MESIKCRLVLKYQKCLLMSYDALIDDLLSLSHAETSTAKTATALELVLNGDVGSLRLLLQDERNAKRDLRVNARNPHSGRALLHEACAEGHLDVVTFLLEKTDADLMLRTMLVLTFAYTDTVFSAELILLGL